MVLGALDGTVGVWDRIDGQWSVAWLTGHADAVMSVSISRDRQHVV